MAHLITEWDNEAHTIMRVTYQFGWTWDDLEANLPLEAQMLDSVDHRVNVIADFRNTDLPFGAFSRLPKIAQSPPYTHRNSGMMVMVASPGFMQEVVAVYKRLYGHAAKLLVVGELDAARKLIAEKMQETAAVPSPEPVAEKPIDAKPIEVGAHTPDPASTKPPEASVQSLDPATAPKKLEKPLLPGPAPESDPKKPDPEPKK